MLQQQFDLLDVSGLSAQFMRSCTITKQTLQELVTIDWLAGLYDGSKKNCTVLCCWWWLEPKNQGIMSPENVVMCYSVQFYSNFTISPYGVTSVIIYM